MTIAEVIIRLRIALLHGENLKERSRVEFALGEFGAHEISGLALLNERFGSWP